MALAVGAMSASTAALALEAGDWLIRVRAIGIEPTGDSNGIAPDLLTSSLEPQFAIMPEIDFTYMVTSNIGLELIAETSPHDIEGQGAIAGLGNVANSWLLPPTLLLQYHFDTNSRFRPYLGAGVNYTITWGENADASLEGVLGPTDVKLDNSLGFAVQAGMDIEIDDRWFVNLDVKYIDIDAKLTSGGVIRTTDVSIDPIIFGVGIGYRF